LGVVNVLEAIRIFNKKIKFYQASSSEMYGKVNEIPQSENTKFYPRSPYGVAKVFGHWMTVNYRESYDMFAVSGILFNHESPLRGIEFVTRKITDGVAKIKNNTIDKISLGNLYAKRDWGHAKDYVNGMFLMLQQENPDDYVLASGETHTIKHFVELSFNEIGIDLIWKGKGLDECGIDSKTNKVLVNVDKKYYRPNEVDLLIGDPSKAKSKLGWNCEYDLKKLVNSMMTYDLNLNP